MGLLSDRAARRRAHEALIAELVRYPQRWEALRPRIADAAAARWRSRSARDRAHAALARRLWDDVLARNVLTETKERRLTQVIAGLALPQEPLAGDLARQERAIVARANAGRLPTPVARPRVVAPRQGELVHLELTAAVGERRRPRADAVVADRGLAAVTSERIVYLGELRSLQLAWGDLVDLQVTRRSVVLAGAHGVHELIVPMPEAVAAIARLQSGRRALA